MEQFGEPQRAKVSGFNFFGDDDDREPDNAYNIPELKSIVKVKFAEECYGAKEFFDRVMFSIDLVNKNMGQEKVKMQIMNLKSLLPDDILFKFDVTCYGQEWRYYSLI